MKIRERERIWLAIIFSWLICPLGCGSSFALMMGEGPMPDGHIGQAPGQFQIARLLGIASIVTLSAGLLLVGRLSAKQRSPSTYLLVRVAGIGPLMFGVTQFYLAWRLVIEGNLGEGIVSIVLGLVFIVASYFLLTAPRGVVKIGP